MRLSGTLVDPKLPYWRDYLPFLQCLAGKEFPSCERLNAMLPDGLRSETGQSICFVPSDQHADSAYERRIYTTGMVSTRPENWHDLFNALVWMCFPQIKIAMNTMHYHSWSHQRVGTRGRVRDALTLFDECGVIVCSNRLDLLTSLVERRWRDAFLANDFGTHVQTSICGHAMLEKYLAPYKSMTAKALLVHTGADFQKLPREDMLTHLDGEIAKRMLAGTLMTKPAHLTPLPLAGIPGWWNQDQQDDGFYNDPQVFRSPPANLVPVRVLEL